MTGPKVLLIVGGGIAAYKACELVRLIRLGVNGVPGEVSCVLTEGGSKFITAMTLAALSENPVHTTLWDLTSETEMGHIQLSRAADLVVVCPATADLLAKMANGIADDMATTLLLATDKPVMAVPAMNVRMWEHAATQRNVQILRDRGVTVIDPDEGMMACGEFGPGRLPEPAAIWHAMGRELGLDVPLLAAPALTYVDADPPESEDTGLGGLIGGLIQRSTTSRVRFEDEDLPEDADFTDVPPEEFLPEAQPDPAVLLTAPILSKKGKAKAAPPTDPEAINHLVNDQTAPEPIKGDDHGVSLGTSLSGALAADPLLGQPDFAPDDPEVFEGPLSGKHVLITAGPTHEPIDPVRYIANRSSGKQGFAIAAAAARAGARVTLVAGPVNLPTPPGVDRIDIETARDMAAAVKEALPADVAIMVAAVADWRTSDFASEKLKKRGSAPPALRLTENPDILATVSGSPMRPKLLIGFAAETENVIPNAKEKRTRKGADWIIANDVSGGNGKSVMGGDANSVHIVTAKAIDTLPEMPKDQVAAALVERIANALAK